VGCAGPKPVGLTGEMGDTGPMGNMGPRPIGATGLMGPPRLVGPVGPTGAGLPNPYYRGATGATGCVGCTGPVGPTGPRGCMGIKPIPVMLPKLKEDPTPENIYNNLYTALDLTMPMHVNFKNLCDSLSVENNVNMSIKSIILDKATLYGVIIDDIYKLVTMEIYENHLTDFEIVFPDNNVIPCLKAMIKTIPYFSIMFEDVETTNHVNVSVDYYMMSCVIELLYNPTAPVQTWINYVQIFELMDKYLMKDHFNIMINHGKHNMKVIMEHLLSEKQFDKITLLHRILSNIVNEKGVDSDDAKQLIYKMAEIDPAEFMDMIEGWQEIYNDRLKLNFVKTHKKYELLNIANINPDLVVSLLAEIDFSHDVCQDMLDWIVQHKANLKFCPNNKVTSLKIVDRYGYVGYFPIIIIESYYPVLTYRKVIKLPVNTINKTISTINSITLQYKESSNTHIMVGTKLIFGKIETTQDINNIYTVESIIKKGNAQTSIVDRARYNSTNVNDDIMYELILDKTYENDAMNFVWVLRDEITHNII
jgi:hypothetical protein